MTLLSNLSLNLYSVIILAILYIHLVRHDDRSSFQYKLFTLMLKVTCILLAFDTLSRFDGRPGTYYVTFNYWGNLVVFLLNPVLPSLWILYVHYQIYDDQQRTMKLLWPLGAVNLIHGAMVVLGQHDGWFYLIDNANVYHRGPLYLLSAAISVVIIFVAFGLIFTNRRLIEYRYYFSLVFFAVPPLISIGLQIMFYGISIMLNSVVISILIVFLNIQNQRLYTDHLTGIFNRKKLEVYLKKKIELSTRQKTFSAIMLDIDDFKIVNDTYGHDAGDLVLEAAAKRLKNCMRSNDLVARFGGDEFYIILEVYTQEDLEIAVERIKNGIQGYAVDEVSGHKLHFSMGYAVYDYNAHMSPESFQKHLDTLMYEDKLRRKVLEERR